MAARLVALCFSIWTAMHPSLPRRRDARPIAAACASAVVREGARAPALGSHAEDVAACAYYAARESSLERRAVGDGGRSFGPWQEQRGAALVGGELGAQAAYWLGLLHEGARLCPDHPTEPIHGTCGGRAARAADARLREARRLLRGALELSPSPAPPLGGAVAISGAPGVWVPPGVGALQGDSVAVGSYPTPTPGHGVSPGAP